MCIIQSDIEPKFRRQGPDMRTKPLGSSKQQPKSSASVSVNAAEAPAKGLKTRERLSYAAGRLPFRLQSLLLSGDGKLHAGHTSVRPVPF